MATNQDLPATDSAAALHELIGDDATATFENDPKFIDANPTAGGSSENLDDPKDRNDIRQQPDLRASAAADEDDEDDEDEDEDDLEDDDDDEDDLEDDEDEDDLEDDEEDDEYEDDDDDEDEDDADEVSASPAIYSRASEDADQDTGDVASGVDEDALEEDELDTDRVTSNEALSAAVRLQDSHLQTVASAFAQR